MNLSVGVVISLLAGVLFVNYLIIIAWYLAQRSRAKGREGAAEEGVKKARSVLKRKQRQILNADVDNSPLGEFDRYSTPPQRTSSRREQFLSVGPPPFSLPPLPPPKAYIPPGPSPLRNGSSASAEISRQNSRGSNSDSASVYSTASATPDRHDQLLSSQSSNASSAASRRNAAVLPRGMNTPRNVTRDIGLFHSQLPKGRTVARGDSFLLWDNSPPRLISDQPWPSREERPEDVVVTPDQFASLPITPMPPATFPARPRRNRTLALPPIFSDPPEVPLPPVPTRI
ncbi:hypothetical protein NLJ89_g7565 [Agrocybe chaxingu]|uniref:Uncharacterized protein n=1 Tax=Agrocybe chaxingu TaxID=84603 RepID=A0A9W8K474_9AGAR|nr:hypothetical protein NLJ89_g7565 [Agrocybe chaxingu]